MKTKPDLNLLITLDVLLAEGNVARAAQRLKLSPSAMSRALARLRETTGDPLLVRAGRGLVPTPRALELRERVRRLVEETEEVLRPHGNIDMKTLARTFTLRTRDGFVENFGPELVRRVQLEAPAVRLRFMLKTDKDSTLLRNGTVDLETGVINEDTSREVHQQALFPDKFVGVVREGHPLSRGAVTAARFAEGQHILVSRRGVVKDWDYNIIATVSGFSSALALARGTDLIATVPERHTGKQREGMFTFPLPVPRPTVTVSMLWHPRLHNDPAHKWLRECLRTL